jgi:hypothetical protein
MKIMTTRAITTKSVAYQCVGYVTLLLLIVGDEVLDIPHNLLGLPATPINWGEALLEGAYIIALGLVSVYLSQRLLRRIKVLEGFLPICSHCKKIRKDNEWEALEKYMSDHSDAFFSHGVCPECARQYYREFSRHEAPASSLKPEQ